jgi:Kef-type K+ transport system membrane component KefB
MDGMIVLPGVVLASAASPASGPSEQLAIQLLYALIVILTVTRVAVALLQRVGQTDVSGEIFAGLLLGPSLLGALAPNLMDGLFTSATSPAINGLAQIGLVLLMFQIGLEFDFSSMFRSGKRTVVSLGIVSVALPFTLGYLSAPFFYEHLPESSRPALLGFRLFFAVAMSITAVPVLGRILIELRLSRTRVGALAIGAASLNDVIGWLLLGGSTLAVARSFSASWVLWHVLGLLAYLIVVMTVVRPLLRRHLVRSLADNGRLAASSFPVVLVVLFCSAAVTSNLDVFAIIGGFVIGIALHGERAFIEEWGTRVAPLVNALLLPLFFVYTGLHTDIGMLANTTEIGLCLLVLAIAFGGKLGAGYLAMRAAGGSHREATTIGVCMNTRGLMELVVINIGLELGILPPSMYTKLVILAIVSTFIAAPLIRWLMADQPLAPVRSPRPGAPDTVIPSPELQASAATSPS